MSKSHEGRCPRCRRDPCACGPMTPPDSGEREVCVVCSLPATRGDDESGRKYWCDKHGPFYDKPDSGDREVREFPADADGVCRTKHVLIPQDLAQRILAALDVEADRPGGMYMRALATELRAIVERK